MKKLLSALLIIVVFTAGCITLTPTTPTGDTQLPTAYIDTISPSEVSPGDMVEFEGHGTDPSDSIVAYRWRSDIDGDLSSKASFETSTLSEGEHNIYFKVQNNKGAWSTEVRNKVVVSGVPIASKPVIVSFSANPGSISSGGSSTLSWNVTGATTVSIDQGVGGVALSGTRVVSPTSSTIYTLTATNTAGSVTATAQVLVAAIVPPPPTGIPDLIIEDITRAGSTVSYTIKNQGNADAGATISKLVIDGAVKANDPVGPLAAGASSTESFSYSYTCSGVSDAVDVQADKDDAVTESNEGNNELSESWSCLIIGPGVILIAQPDLVITDIWKVSEITGDKIYYKIKNIGNGASAATNSGLYFYPCVAPCSPTATDYVPALAAGAESTQKFASYNWGGGAFNIGVKADNNEAVLESDETNNSKTVAPADL
jgi:subtilase family serine protease